LADARVIAPTVPISKNRRISGFRSAEQNCASMFRNNNWENSPTFGIRLLRDSAAAPTYRLGMPLDRIRLTQFRNHPDTALDQTARFNLLVGENGAGKTNVLEALSLLAPGRGLRRAAMAEIAAHGSDSGFAVSADLGGDVQLGTGVRPERPGRRVVQVNGADIAAVGLGEWLSVGWLTPAMDRLFMDSAGARRRFLDRLVLALEPGHARHAAKLEAALRERGRLLGEPSEPDPQWLSAIEGQIAEAGALVAQARARLVSALSAALERLPEAPFARPALEYRPGGPLDEAELSAALAAGRSRDRAAQRTLTGPHRDELGVTMAGKGEEAAACSTGEQKALLLGLVLAHAELVADRVGRAPILLLDEVAAHLDPVRRAALFDRLAATGSQVWITGTERAPFDDIGAASWFAVADGTVLPA